MKGSIRFEILTFFALVTRLTFGVEKFWLPDLQWQTPRNWMDNKVPEIDSHVVFPLETRHVVGMPESRDFRLTGIDLARFGSLILPRDGKLELRDSGKSPTRVSRWLREGHLFWADPENWNGTSKAAPHLEQVPCRQDDIVLPDKNRAFSALLPMREIQVRSIRTSDRKTPYVAWQWDDFANRREFDKGIFTVKYADYSCEKCRCQDDPNNDYMEEICAIQRPKCGYTPCEYPLKVEGHCCRYCGGRLSLSKTAYLSVVREAVISALEGYTERIAWHVRRTWNGAAEILIKEKGEYSGLDILKMAKNIKENLLGMNIDVLSTEVSGAALQDHQLPATLVPLFGTPFVILFILFLALLYFGYSSRYILSSCTEIFTSVRDGMRMDKPEGSKPFSFARFENISEGNVQIADVAGSSEQKLGKDDTVTKEPSGGRFENPLYRSKKRRKDEEETLDMEAPLSLATLKDRVEDSMEEIEMDIDQ
ncbi:protein amnionless [Colletes latitarsis]|uniref:protein amnionless n=1 Tax=Colletes latitarsis TaxID=2605962 RepID=UPI00403596E6